MRELHDWHGGRHRHVRDVAVDAPKHARDHSHNPRKLEIVSDPAARVAESLQYQKTVQEYQAKHAADQLKPQEAKPKHASPEARERETKAALAEVDDRTLPKSGQVKDVAASQKRRVSDKDISYLGLLGSYIVKTTAEYVSVIPPHLAGDISGGLLVLAAGIVLGREKHWKDGNADRSQD